jgi:DNA-binding transcriptional MerR regulator
VKVPTTRFYEQIGLLAAPARTQRNRRLYEERDLRRLTFIRHARELGFEMPDIRALLSLQDRPQEACDEADAIAEAKLAEVRRRIASLKALEDELMRMVDCRHGRAETCRVIETLADHGCCKHHHHVSA